MYNFSNVNFKDDYELFKGLIHEIKIWIYNIE